MKITTQHVEAMLQELFLLGERTKMVRNPVPGIIMPGKSYPEVFRVWLMPEEPGDSEDSVTYYEGTQRECTCYIAELTMRLALEKVFGGIGPLGLVPPNEPRDSLPQTDGEPTAA